MKRYIDANKLQKEGWKLERRKKTLTVDEHEVMELDAVPIADVVEVVRCKYCRHRDEDIGMGDRRWCYIVNGTTHSDNFCKYGERK